MIIVGLTGGIGSGKSTVARLFSAYGIPVYYTDDEAKRLMITSKIIKRKLIQKFGNEAYIDNELNKPYLASLIFSNKTHLNYVNSIVHPKVAQHFKRWVKKQALNKNCKYVIQENAILFENGTYVDCDVIITVTAPKQTRIDRVVKRDKTTENKVLERINIQLSDDYKIERSDFIIKNIEKEKTKVRVLEIHNKIIELSTSF
jgi:dephospho-CoA kinase